MAVSRGGGLIAAAAGGIVYTGSGSRETSEELKLKLANAETAIALLDELSQLSSGTAVEAAAAGATDERVYTFGASVGALEDPNLLMIDSVLRSSFLNKF